MDYALAIDGLHKTFRRRDGATVPAIDGVDLALSPGEFVVLLGPSGCGKTTLLRSIAGLETPDGGTIRVGGQKVFSGSERINVPPERRGLSMMFQSYALWPHMTAQRNVRYPLENIKEGRRNRTAMAARVDEVLAQVGIAELGGQYPAQLSGGQQQRVALARALVTDSPVVLFDEPLSNVDAKVREQLRIELLSTQKRIGFTGVFVTHDQAEAMQLASRIAVLDQGKIQQFGPPAEIYSNPATEYVARFIGHTNELPTGRPTAPGVYATSLGEFHTPDGTAQHAAANLLWRPESGRLFREQPVGPNILPGRHLASHFMGTHTEHLVQTGSTTSRVWSQDRETYQADESVWIQIEPADLLVFGTDKESDQESAPSTQAALN